jgi:oligopeptide/dipeptide ABC transporter ATP-binding protein
MKPLLKACGLKKHFSAAPGFLRAPLPPVQAVDGVSFDVAPGELLALVGESGSGKSTLGRLVLRLIEPSEGELVFNGNSIDLSAPVESAYRKAVQIIFQDSRASLNPRRTIFQILGDPMMLHGLATRANIRQHVAALLERVGLAPAERFIDRYPRQFSGGQLQRIGIARALSLGPRLIVADEPVSALDTLVRAQILDLLMALRREEALAFLFITHDLAVVRNIADRVAVMYLGRIVESGSVDAIFERPAHPYTQALLSATPIPDPKRGKAGRIVLKGEIPSPRNPPRGCRFHPRCPQVMAICRTEDPAERITPGGVRTACHLYPLNQAGA